MYTFVVLSCNVVAYNTMKYKVLMKYEIHYKLKRRTSEISANSKKAI